MNPINKLYYFLNHTGKNIPKTPKVNITFYHLTFVLEGSFTYIADGKEYVLTTNDALLMIPGSERERLYIPEKVRYIIVNYIPTKEYELKSNIFLKGAVNSAVLNYINACPCKIFTSEQTQNTNEENIKKQTILLNQLNCILIELFSSLKNKSKNPHINNAVRYIDENIYHPLSLENVCNAIHLSKSYTTRLFKTEMNMTVSEYINNRKLDIAKAMLANSDISLQEISGSLGYENYCYFSKKFKERFGISPLKTKKSFER